MKSAFKNHSEKQIGFRGIKDLVRILMKSKITYIVIGMFILVTTIIIVKKASNKAVPIKYKRIAVSKKSAAYRINGKTKKYSMNKFLKINMGMKYGDVVSILGKCTQKRIVDDKKKLISYQWRNNDDSSILIEMQNDIVVSKAQVRLEKENAKVNIRKYYRINKGMSYSKVKCILGKGELISQTTLMGSTSTMYEWINSDDSKINITFTDGKSDMKSQIKLK